ncbi:MAG: hypothetical protein K9G38_08095 [Bacteroidales bacterium]|nr:hypothetical protein [Bacteroidales bacterium]
MDRTAPTTLLTLVSISAVLLLGSINTGIITQQNNPEEHHSGVVQKSENAGRYGITTDKSVSPFKTRGEIRSMVSPVAMGASEPKEHLHPLSEQNAYGSATMAPIDLLIPPWHEQPDR